MTALRAITVMGLCSAIACSSGKSAQGGGGSNAVARVARVDMTESSFNGATVHVVLVVDNQGNKDVEIVGASIEAAYEGEAVTEGLGPFQGAMQPKRERVAVAPGGSAEVP